MDAAVSYQAAAQASLMLLHDFPVAAAHKLGDALRAARTLGAYDATQESRSVNFDDQTWQMTPERALAHLQGRVPQSWKKVEGLQDGLLKAQAFWVTGVEQEDALEEILDALNAAMVNGTPYDAFAKEWAARFEDEGLSQGRLQTVFRTNLFSAYQGGRMAAFQTNPGVDLLTYMTAGDDRVRPEHAARAGVTLPKDHPFWADNTPPIDYNCFPGHVRVEADAVAASKAMYSGPIRRLVTARSHTLTLTPNHPVLTSEGWKAAKDLRKGDHLVSYEVHVEEPSGMVDDQDGPPAIQDVFDAICLDGVRQGPVAPRSLDFHGDAQFFQGEIDIVSANGVLCVRGDASISKLANEFRIVVGHPEFASAPALGASQKLGLWTRDASHFGPGLPADALQGLGIAGSVTPTSEHALTTVPDLNPSLVERSKQGHTATPDLLSQLFERNAGLVAFDELVQIEDGDFSGHVYDLQTVSGVIVAEGIITSNCRCYVRMASDGATRTPESSEALDLPRAANFAAKAASQSRDLLNGYLARKAEGFERLKAVPDDDPLLGRFLKTSLPKSYEPQRGTSPAAETQPAPGYVTDPLGRAVALTDPAIEAAGDGSDLIRGTIQDPLELWSVPMRGDDGHTLQATYLQRVSPAGYLAVPVRDGVACGSPHVHATITPDPSPFRRGVRLI